MTQHDSPNSDPSNELNPDPGGLTMDIADDSVIITMTGGSTWNIPLGPITLAAGELSNDPPKPADLTNALGFIHDYFDDIVGAAPSVLATPSVAAVGRHARALAGVEVGSTNLPDDYQLQRVDADEVFRTLVAEPRSERLHNPGLDTANVDTIIGTLCIVLAIMRRLDLDQMAVLT
jgi:exopolyphosphatase/pppGpp-phosphohydrolase